MFCYCQLKSFMKKKTKSLREGLELTVLLGNFSDLSKEKYENTLMHCFLQTYKANMITHYIIISGRVSFDHHIFRNLM